MSDDRNGTVRYDTKTNECYVIWNDNPCRPELFPLIAKYTIREPTLYLPITQSSQKKQLYIYGSKE
jgi:hypothetical protein